MALPHPAGKLRDRAKHGIVGVALTAMALLGLCTTSYAGTPEGQIEPLGKSFWCAPTVHRLEACGGFLDQVHPTDVMTITTGFPIRNLHVCVEGPVGRSGCILQRSGRIIGTASGPDGKREKIRVVKFNFFKSFPHDQAGIYRLHWRFHQARIGETVRFRLTLPG